jgi:hypothetical protein
MKASDEIQVLQMKVRKYSVAHVNDEMFKGESVRYHVDQCTKNKRMIQIPTCGLCLTSTESSF